MDRSSKITLYDEFTSTGRTRRVIPTAVFPFPPPSESYPLSALNLIDSSTHTPFPHSWCGPCHQLSPVIESLTAEPQKSGSGLPLDLIKVNTDTDEGVPLAQTFKVS